MSQQPLPPTQVAGSADDDNLLFASPTAMDTGFSQPEASTRPHQAMPSSQISPPTSPPAAAPSASTTPMSAPTPLHAAPASSSTSTSTSASSSAAVSRVSSIRSNALPSSSASTTRIRKGLLTRAGSEAEDRVSRAASISSHPPLTTDDDDDDPTISDSGPMPRRFASQNRGPSGNAVANSRQSSNSSLPHTSWVNGINASPYSPYSHNASSTSIASGNRSGSGEASEGGASGAGGVSLGRAMSVSSVSSVNSTSSLEAVPFREAPLGNVRLGFGGAGSRFAGRNARNHPYGSLATVPQQSTAPRPGLASPADQQDLGPQPSAADSRSTHEDPTNNPSLFSPPTAAASTEALPLSSSAPASDRHKGVPKPATDAWMYRVGPGMRTNRPPRPSSAASPELPELPLDDVQSTSSPAKRSREVLRQKFAKGAGRLGIKTNIVTAHAPSPSEQYAVYNPHDSSDDEMGLVPPTRTPLPRSSSYFSGAPHSANLAAGTPLHSMLTPVPADFRTSSVTNAPLFVPKFAEELSSLRLTPEALAPSGPAFAVGDASQAPSLPPLNYAADAGSISSDLSPYLTASAAPPATSANHARRRSSATQKPVLMRNESSNDAFDRTASPGLLVHDPGAAEAPAAEPALYTLSTSALSTQRSSQVELAATPPISNMRVSPHPTPAEVVRMEAQAGIASLPDSPSEPSPVPASYSPATGDEAAAAAATTTVFAKTKNWRPSSATGSEASVSMNAAAAGGTSRRPDSLQRPRLWSNTKRPAILRNRTSESSISKGRRSQSLDRRAYSPTAQSPVEGNLYEASAYDRPGTHSKNSSSSTATGGGGGGDPGVRMPPHVAVIPEDDDGANGSVGTPDRTVVPSPESGALSRRSSAIELDQGMALSPPNAATLPFMVRPMPGPRSASPASQLARSPETIRVGPARITDSIYGRSPASISNLQSPRLLPSSGPNIPERSTTPSPRTTSARGPNDFHFGDTLGEGSYSTVLEAWDLLSGPFPKEPGVVDPNATSAAAAMVGSESSRRRRRRIDLTGRKAYAIKVLDKVHILKQGKQKYVSIEKEALSRMIRHAGVVTLFWTFQDRESLYFVLELANNGELLNHIRKHGSFDLESARFYAAQLADTIDAMHAAGVVHRDVKPENILLDAKYRIKITDFGSAKIVHPVGGTELSVGSEETSNGQASRAASFVGTAEYVSPELLVEKASPAGKPADWWAFGCVLFQMLAGRPPFKGVNEYQTLQKVKNRDFSFPQGFPEDAQDLIDKVLTLNPADRPGAAEIKSHRFFGQVNFDTLWDQDVPDITTGLVQPLPQSSREFEAATSDFSFDEVLGSSDDSQAYQGDTGSIHQLQHVGEGGGETRMDDADDSDSDAENIGGAGGGGGGGGGKRQSGFQRLADGFQNRFMSSPQTGGMARRRFSNMSIDAAPASATAEAEPGVGNRAMRPISRSMQSMTNHSPSPSSTTRLAHQPSAAASSTTPTTTTGSVGAPALQHSWTALLLPKEVMLYTLPVAQKKTGTGKMFTKRRQLVITDFPRLLCVKETSTAFKVKSEVILAIPSSNNAAAAGGGGGGDGETGFEKLSAARQSSTTASTTPGYEGDPDEGAERSQQQQQQQQQQVQAIPNLLTGLDYRGGRSFTVRIANGRVFVYETLAGDASGLVRCIHDARRAAA